MMRWSTVANHYTAGWKIFLVIFLLSPVLIGTCMASPSSIIDLKKEIMIEPGKSPDTKNIITDEKGNYIVVGSLNKQGWATKVDSEGNVKWRFETQFSNKDPEHIVGPNEVAAAALASDDSTFLIRTEPAYVRTRSPAIITHVDENGKIIGEKSIYPSSPENDLSGSLSFIATVNDGFIGIGIAKRYLPNDNSPVKNGPPFILEVHYWIVKLDSKGEVGWEKLYSPPERFLGEPQFGPIQILSNGDLVFTANRFGTEVVKVRGNGDLQFRKIVDYSNNFSLVKPVKVDNEIKLINFESKQLIYLTLDEMLNETKRFQENCGAGTIRNAYRLPDETLILFGGKDSVQSSYSRVMALSSSLQNQQDLVLASKPDTSLWVQAATPANGDGQFILVRPFLDEAPNKLHSLAQKPSRGLILDLVSLNPQTRR